MDHNSQCKCPLCELKVDSSKVGPDFILDNTKTDPLLDRGCVIFDGACDCKAPALYNCKRYTSHMII